MLPKSTDKDPVLEIPQELRTQKPSRGRVQTEQQFVNFAEIEQTRDLAADDLDDDFIFGKEEPELIPQAPVPRKEATASLRFAKNMDSANVMEIPWEMSQEVAGIGSLQSEAPQRRKSSGILKPLFLLLLLGCFIGGTVYLWNMKRETATISLGTQKSTVPTEHFEKANTLFHGAIAKAESALIEKDKEIWDKRYSETRIPIMAALEKAISKAKKKGDVGNTETMLERGLKALESGNLSLARGSFIHVLDAQPGNSEAVTGLGWVKLESGNATAAAREFRRALSLNPNYGQAYMGLGQALRESGRPQAALDAYSKYLKRFPRGSRAGIARYQQGELTRKLGLDKKEEKVEEKEATPSPVKKDEKKDELKKEQPGLDKKDEGKAPN